MDRFHEMRVFVEVAEAGSFAKASRVLRLSPPAVTRAVSALEERLGIRLFNRTTRSVSLTEAGQRFLLSSNRVLSELEDAERDVVGDAGVVQGHLNVTASVTFGRTVVAPLLGSFLAANPRLSLSLVMLDRVTNLVEEGFDVAIRIGDLPDSTLMARRIGQVRRLLVASPEYLAKRGAPASPDDLKLHSIIGFTSLMSAREVSFEELGKRRKLNLRPRLEVNDAAAAIAAAETGEGVTTSLCYIVGESIRSGRLVPVLQEFWPAPAPVHIVYPHSRLLAAKVRAFVDWAAQKLAPELQRLSATD